MGHYILDKMVVTDLGRYNLASETLTIDQFNERYDEYLRQGFTRETYFQPVGNVEMSKTDGDGNMMLISFNYKGTD